MSLKIHLLDPPDADSESELRRCLDHEVRITMGRTLPESLDFEILVAGRPEIDHLIASPKLNKLIIPWAGLPDPTRELLLKFPQIDVHNLHHNAAPTAELAVALLMAAAKYIVPHDRSLRKHDWRARYKPSESILLQDKSLLILGFGVIGRRIGEVCQALGMNVVGIRRSPLPEDPLESDFRIYGPDALQDLLEQTHVLIIALPGTPETENWIGREELYRMPPGGILVNIGRGKIVDQEALFECLTNKHLAAAGLDVWYNYPKSTEERENTAPADLPFHQLENVVMSPHRGGHTQKTETLRMRHLAELLNTAARGEELPNRVDVRAGY